MCGVRPKGNLIQEEKWTHWDLNPGPSACEADVIPLHHVPLEMAVLVVVVAAGWRSVEKTCLFATLLRMSAVAQPRSFFSFLQAQRAFTFIRVSAPAPTFKRGLCDSMHFMALGASL